mgnify:CR=1 FL=1
MRAASIIPLNPSILAWSPSPPRFRAGNAKGKLEVLLVADENIRQRSDVLEGFVQLRFTPLPERGAVVKVEGHARAVALRLPRQLRAEYGGL